MSRTSWSWIAARAAVAVFALLTSIPAEAEEVTTTADSQRFAKLVEAGDRARRAQLHAEAFAIYNKALDIHRDPAVDGRMGLVMLAMNDYAAAAEYLLRAITRAQASQELMREFHQGFALTRSKVCFVEVFVSEINAEVDIDGETEQPTESNAFQAFLAAGTHVLHAKLKGFEDATTTIDAPAGGELKVKLEMKALPPPPPAYIAPATNQGWGPDPGLEPDPPKVGKPPTSLSNSYTHFLVGAGPVLVVGATPGVALGPHLTVGVRRWFVSGNLDARIVWPVGGPERYDDLQLISWAIGLRPCAHYAFVFGCGVLQVDGLNSLSGAFGSGARVGGGPRAGLEFVIRKPVRLQVWADVMFRLKGYDVTVDGKGLVSTSAFVGGFGVTTFLTF